MNNRGEVVTGLVIIVVLFTVFGVLFGRSHQKYVDSKETKIVECK